MSPDSEQHNRAPRIERPFTIRICEDGSDGQVRWDIVTAKNLSASGVLFNYGRYLEPGSRIRFRITLPVCESIECEGEVVRNVMGKSHGFDGGGQKVCAVAATFQNVSDHDRQVMEKFLSGCAAAAPKPEGSAHSGPKQARERRVDRSFPFWMQRPGETDWEAVPMRNISASGVLVNYPEPLEEGTELAFRMMLPFVESPVLCKGTVVRSVDKTRPGASVKIFNIGVQFSELDETVKQQMREFAEKAGRE